jgi:hypothetical protein
MPKNSVDKPITHMKPDCHRDTFLCGEWKSSHFKSAENERSVTCTTCAAIIDARKSLVRGFQ